MSLEKETSNPWLRQGRRKMDTEFLEEITGRTVYFKRIGYPTLN